MYFLKSLVRFGSRYVFSSSLFSTTVTLITLIAYNASVVFSKVTTIKWLDNGPPFIWYAQKFMGFLDVLEICRTTRLTLWGVESVWDSDLTGTRCEIFFICQHLDWEQDPGQVFSKETSDIYIKVKLLAHETNEKSRLKPRLILLAITTGWCIYQVYVIRRYWIRCCTYVYT